MKILPLDSIQVHDHRQRKSFDAARIGDLATSIATHGLFNPLVLRGSALVQGERRLRALRLLEMQGLGFDFDGSAIAPGHAPCTDLGELSPIQAEECELEENLRRENLTWQEEAAALARIHELRKAANPEQTKGTTAVELFPDLVPRAALLKVQQAVDLASRMHDPDIAGAKNVTEAFKIARRKDEAERRTALSAAAPSHSSRHTIVLQDCKEWLVSCASDTFDCIITDPPYGMGADSFGDAAGKLAGIDHQYDDTTAGTQRLLRTVIPELYRVSKPQSHLYLWCDIDLFHWLKQTCTDAGYYVFRTPLINIKREGGRVPLPEHGPRRCYELCLYAIKGDKPVTAIYPDVFESTLTEGNLGHGAQKPVEAYINLLRRSCVPGNRVLDCFAGSGPLLDAAEELQLVATLVENAPHAHGIQLEKLAKLGAGE